MSRHGTAPLHCPDHALYPWAYARPRLPIIRKYVEKGEREGTMNRKPAVSIAWRCDPTVPLVLTFAACSTSKATINSFVDPVHERGTITTIAFVPIRNAQSVPTEARRHKQLPFVSPGFLGRLPLARQKEAVHLAVSKPAIGSLRHDLRALLNK